MNLILTTVLGLALIAMLISAVIIAFGWLGLLVYFCIGALLWLDHITKYRDRQREHARLTGAWWRELT